MMEKEEKKMMEKEVIIEDGKVVKESKRGISPREVVKGGATFGTCLAMVISYVTWKSVLWAILHGILSWAYVIYFVVRYGIG